MIIMKHKNLLSISTLSWAIWFSFCLLGWTACTKKDKVEDKELTIIGAWVFKDGKEYFQANGGGRTLLATDPSDIKHILEFKKDGSFVYYEDGEAHAGTYQLNGNSISIDYAELEMEDGRGTVLQLDSSTLVVEFIFENQTDDEDRPGTGFYIASYQRK